MLGNLSKKKTDTNQALMEGRKKKITGKFRGVLNC